MNKPVVIGSSLFVISLVAAAWLLMPASEPYPQPEIAALITKTAPHATPVTAAITANPTHLSTPAIAALTTPAANQAITHLPKTDRRKRLKELRAELSALMSQGNNISPEKTLVLLKELEQLSEGEMDPRYFQGLRQMLEHSMQIQKLNIELQQLSQNTTGQNSARMQIIIKEIKDISIRISQDAALLKTYTPTSTSTPNSTSNSQLPTNKTP